MKKNYKKEALKIQDRKGNQKKVVSYMSNGKVMIIHLISGLIKKSEFN